MIKKYYIYLFYNFNLLLPNVNNINLYKIFPKSSRFYIKPNHNCKELVIYGSNLESSLSTKNYTNIVRYMVNIPNHILYIIIGIIISDGYIEYKSKKNIDKDNLFKNEFNIDKIKYDSGLITNINCRLRFKQSMKNNEYV